MPLENIITVCYDGFIIENILKSLNEKIKKLNEDGWDKINITHGEESYFQTHRVCASLKK